MTTTPTPDPSVFSQLLREAHDAGLRHIGFAVDLDAYFPYPSPKGSWFVEGYVDASELATRIEWGRGRSGEEALRDMISKLNKNLKGLGT